MGRYLFSLILIVVSFSLLGNSVTDAKSTGLVGYWTFDGSNANDFTGYHNGTVVGSGVTFPAGKVGNAVNFSVGSSFIRIPSFNTANITVEAWVNSTKSGYYTSMVTKNYYSAGWSSPYAVWQLWLNENSANPGVFASQFGALSPEAVSMNEWHHMAFTYDGSTTKIYVNGVEKNSAATPAGNITSTAGNIYIGKPESSNHSFTGMIDEVAIWDNALSGTEILKHYQNGLIGLGYLESPVLATDSISNVTISSAVSGGNITSDGGSEVTARGVCWNTTGNPTTADSLTVDGSGTGEFISTLTGLSAGTTYFVRAYAVNSIGTTYGDEFMFTTLNYFTDINAGLVALCFNSVEWGDYDNDGDLDILSTGGTDEEGVGVSRIYNNDLGVFTDINADLTGVFYSSVEWGDYDNDGDLDILLTGWEGWTGSQRNFSQIYNNDSGVFTDINADIAAVFNSSVAWGDYDNDGDLDILLTGNSGTLSTPILISKVYQNNGDGIFTDIDAGLTGVHEGSVAWGDYDNDGDLDVLLSGATGVYPNYNPVTKIYKNDAGIFTDIGAGLTAVFNSSVAWGDYDNDGDLDILLTGYTGVKVSKIYQNESGIFTDISAGQFQGVSSGSVAWGDYDNDGDLDILLSGSITKIYRNDGDGIFTDINAGLLDLESSSVAWGDYDNDGDLDIFLGGEKSTYSYRYIIYRNNSIISNTAPLKPSGLITQLENDTLMLSFNPSTDNETLQSGLSYNLDIELNGNGYKPGMSVISNGYRKVVELGNTNQNTFFYSMNFFANLPQEETKNVLWRVQAIDHCFAGSEFSEVADTSFVSKDLNFVIHNEMVADDYLTWEYAFPDSISNYQLQLDDDINFESPIEEIITLNKEKDSKIINYNIALNELTGFDSLISDTRYYWRVKPNYIYRASRYPDAPASFIYDPTYSAPSPVSISVDGNYITLSWGTGKEGEKNMLYNVYSSDDPHSVFPGGWTLVNSVTGTSYLMNSTLKKKFYCVTAAGSVK